MNTKKKWRLALTPIAVAAIIAPAVACSQLGVANPLDSLCCKEFTAGADLSAVDWGIKGTGEVSFASFMQASADFTGAASAMVNDVGNACQQIAIDLGAAEDAVKDTDPAARTKSWCDLAVKQIGTAGVKGKLTIVAQPPVCTFSASAQANCEAKCTVNAMCTAELGDITARCDPGSLSVKCGADCTGSCEGSANLAVTCDGTCSGSCEGTCDGQAAGGMASGECKGACKGKCRGSCKATAGAKVACEGQCTGGCSGMATAPKCTAQLKPPSANCKGDASCNGSCSASASAKAECKDPSIEIGGSIDPKIIATLKLNLPKIFAVAQVRGKMLVDNATAVVNFGADFGAKASGDLSVKAVACAIPAVSAIGAAAANVKAGFEASLSVVASVN